MATLQITTEAQKLGQRIDQTIEKVRQKFSDSYVPDPSWQMYSAAESNRRMSEKQAVASRQNRADLVAATKEVNAMRESMRVEIQKRLYPMMNAIQKSDAFYYEEKGERLVRLVGVGSIRGEYDEAMRNGLTDLASSIVDWSERVQDAEDPAECQAYREMRAAHIKALDLQPLLDSVYFLKGKLDILEGRIKMLDAGYTKGISGAKDATEAEEIFRMATGRS
jgi:hypothetical protein